MSINKRVFGTPIDGEIRRILDSRQGSNPTTDVGEPLYSETLTGLSNYDYASRLPFVRMWTSVKVINPAEVEGTEVNASEITGDVDAQLFDLRKNEIKKLKLDSNNVELVLEKTRIQEIKDNKTGETTKYIIKVAKREQQDFVRKVYEVGNHNYLKNYGEVKTNDSLQVKESSGDGEKLKVLFPQESKNNPYMKPQSGITGISSETEGALGLIKKTTVNFVVHNFEDFDNIFSKYFLAPGASVFVDFGYADIDNLYRPQDLIKFSENEENKGVTEYLYGEPNKGETLGQITKNIGKLEVLQGIVTDYNAKIRQDGGVDCSVTLTSKNSALLSFTTDNDIVMRIKTILTRGILYLGLRAIVEGGDDEDSDNDLKQLMSTPNLSTTSEDIETYNKNLLLLAKQELSGLSGPQGNSIRTGVFAENLNADNTYIVWGLFEDLIINSQFGFGKDSENIVNGKNLQVKMNSSNSYTRWTSENKEKQHVLMQIPEDVPAFLYPDWWYNDDPDDAGGSYSYQKGKLPDIQDDSVGDDFEPTTENDIKIGRIPIREVFINVDMIIKAFEKNSTVKSVILEILGELNKEGDGLFDWKMKEGENDSEITIIDVNYTIASENDKIKIEDNPYFTFEVQSPNSMIKDYNLEFALPSGNIGNMYAIQGLGVGDTLFTTNSSTKEAIANLVIDPESLSIIYEPDMGNHRAKQLLDEPKVDSETYNVFTAVDDLFSNNVYKISTTERPNLIEDTESGLSNVEAVTDDEDNQPSLSATEIIRASDESLESAGFKVAKTFKEYYKFKISSKVEKEIPNLLPYKLSLTIAGISGVQVGDTFKVDYLPNRYIDSTYLQVIQVAHDIGPGGWFTSLETQFRLLPQLTENIYSSLQSDKIRLSPNALTNVGYEDEIEADAGYLSIGNDVKIAEFATYMTDIKVLYNREWAFDYALDFRIANELSGEIENESGYIKNSRGNFYAEFPNKNKRNIALLEQGENWNDNYGDGLGHSYFYQDFTNAYRVWPPDLQIVPGQRYTLMAFGDKIALLDQNSEYYARTYSFFQKYVGVIEN
tara:strand:+ start:2856 stop:6008 length:3153 start_codon:yes stop_codon:yes gene_type:complete